MVIKALGFVNSNHRFLHTLHLTRFSFREGHGFPPHLQRTITDKVVGKNCIFLETISKLKFER